MGNTTSIQDKFTKNCVNVIISSDSFKVQVKFGKKKKKKMGKTDNVGSGSENSYNNLGSWSFER